MSTKFTGEFPTDDRIWRDTAHRHEVVSIYEFKDANSASEITMKQFLSLRVLWPERRTIAQLYSDDIARLFNSSKAGISEMKDYMERNDGAWAKYLTALQDHGIKRSSIFARELGVWALVLQTQAEASKINDSLNDTKRFRLTPYPTRARAAGEQQDLKGKGKISSPERQGSRHPSHTSKSSGAPENISPMGRDEAFDLTIGDEQIVNTAAINFLNALFIHDARPADWTLERKQFKFNSKSVTFEARTDGHFQVHGQERSAAILEVKPRLREYESGFRIEMQESTQMALWIFQEPNSHWAPRVGGANYYRVLLSQDRHEMYVTIAEYTMNYVLYLQEKVDFEHAGFLKMQTYGPFRTDNGRHMSWLGAILRVLLPFAATYQPSRPISPSKLRTPSRSPHPSPDHHLGKPAAKSSEESPQRKLESSPLGGSIKSSTSTSSDTDPTRRLFDQMELGDQPRTSQNQSPQRQSIREPREAARGRSEKPLVHESSPPRGHRPAGSGGERSSQIKGERSDQQGDQASKKRSGKKPKK